MSNFEFWISNICFYFLWYNIVLFFRLIRPVGNSTDRLTVKMGLKLSQIIGVDMKRQILITNVWLEQVRRIYLMSGSSHIWSVLIGVEYRNCCWILDVYLLFVIWMGQIQSKLIYILICNLWTGQFVSYKSVIYFWFYLPKQNSKNKHPKFDANFDIWRQLEHFENEMNRTLLTESNNQFRNYESCIFTNCLTSNQIVFLRKKQ